MMIQPGKCNMQLRTGGAWPQERVELSFALCNPKRVSPSEGVTLQLDVKNVPSLLVKVYEINTRTYYTSTKSEVSW